MSRLEVAVIGAGLAGLTSAIALRKYIPDNVDLDIKVYERLDIRQTTSRSTDKIEFKPQIGAGLGLQGNGIDVFRALDPELADEVLEGGLPCKGFTFRSAGDYLLGWARYPVVAVSRGVLIERLLNHVPSDIVQHTAVKEVIISQHERPALLLEGEEKPRTFDLIIGADGIRSPTRHVMFGDDSKYNPEYTGLAAVGGIITTPVPPALLAHPTMTFTMGPNGVFGYSPLSTTIKDKLLFWSVYDTPLPPRGQTLSLSAIDAALHARHKSYCSPLIQTILRQAKVDNVWPIFVMPALPYWGRDGVVLIGDAAHAMSPRTGQGASQGLEDAQTLGLLLAGNLKNGSGKEDAVAKTLADLYKVRGARVKRLRDEGMKGRDPPVPMRWWQTWLMYAFVILATKLDRFVHVFPVAGRWDAEEVVAEYLAAER